MIKQNVSMAMTKEKIRNYFNKRVEVKVNLGRNKIVSYQGVVTNIYPALFTVTPVDEFKGKIAFSYSEYMCGIVDIKELKIN